MAKELTHVYQIVKESIESKKNVVRIQTDVPADVVMTGFELDGYTAIIVDQAPVFNKFTLLHALYQNCSLPAYFGFNWDALNDAPNAAGDSEESDDEVSEGIMLIFNDFSTLEERAEDVASTFLEIVDEAAEKREANDAPPLKIVALTPAN